MRTEVPGVVSKLETCEQETGWADFISIEISKKATLLPTHLISKRISRIIDQSQPPGAPRSSPGPPNYSESYSHTQPLRNGDI